jgi:hypothetical protein
LGFFEAWRTLIKEPKNSLPEQNNFDSEILEKLKVQVKLGEVELGEGRK